MGLRHCGHPQSFHWEAGNGLCRLAQVIPLYGVSGPFGAYFGVDKWVLISSCPQAPLSSHEHRLSHLVLCSPRTLAVGSWDSLTVSTTMVRMS